MINWEAVGTIIGVITGILALIYKVASTQFRNWFNALNKRLDEQDDRIKRIRKVLDRLNRYNNLKNH